MKNKKLVKMFNLILKMKKTILLFLIVVINEPICITSNIKLNTFRICAFVLKLISLSLVCVCLFHKKKKKKWVIVLHYLRECVMCSITCLTLP